MGTWPGNPPMALEPEPNWRSLYEQEKAEHMETKRKLAKVEEAYSNVSWKYEGLSR